MRLLVSVFETLNEFGHGRWSCIWFGSYFSDGAGAWFSELLVIVWSRRLEKDEKKKNWLFYSSLILILDENFRKIHHVLYISVQPSWRNDNLENSQILRTSRFKLECQLVNLILIQNSCLLKFKKKKKKPTKIKSLHRAVISICYPKQTQFVIKHS